MVTDGIIKPLLRIAFERFKEMLGVTGNRKAGGAEVRD
jgi:hypothetical protein